MSFSALRAFFALFPFPVGIVITQAFIAKQMDMFGQFWVVLFIIAVILAGASLLKVRLVWAIPGPVMMFVGGLIPYEGNPILIFTGSVLFLIGMGVTARGCLAARQGELQRS